MEFVSGNIFIREKAFQESGAKVAGHCHNFDHTTIFFGGRWRVRKWKRAVEEDGRAMLGNDGRPLWIMTKEITFDAPHWLLIEADARHEFEFLGTTVPGWMEPFIDKLPSDDQEEFRRRHNLTQQRNWCIYAHRTPQGDVVQEYTGWEPAYG